MSNLIAFSSSENESSSAISSIFFLNDSFISISLLLIVNEERTFLMIRNKDFFDSFFASSILLLNLTSQWNKNLKLPAIEKSTISELEELDSSSISILLNRYLSSFK